LPLWDRYGAAIVPAMLIDGELALYSGVPTKEKIVWVISKHDAASHQGEKETDNKREPHPEDEGKA
jgi:hypothetical protein